MNQENAINSGNLNYFIAEVLSTMQSFAGTWEEGTQHEMLRHAMEMYSLTLHNVLGADKANIDLLLGRRAQEFRRKGTDAWISLPAQKVHSEAIISRPDLYELRTVYLPIEARQTAAVDESSQFSGCSKCGIIGIHACLGEPIPEWTPEKIAELNEVLDRYETTYMGADEPKAAEITTNESIATTVEERGALWTLSRRAAPLAGLRRLMRSKGVTKEDLRDRLALVRKDWSTDSLTELLRGNSNISIDDLYVLADALNVGLSIDYFAATTKTYSAT